VGLSITNLVGGSIFVTEIRSGLMVPSLTPVKSIPCHFRVTFHAIIASRPAVRYFAVVVTCTREHAGGANFNVVASKAHILGPRTKKKSANCYGDSHQNE
jgi:hypothetical protein